MSHLMIHVFLQQNIYETFFYDFGITVDSLYGRDWGWHKHLPVQFTHDICMSKHQNQNILQWEH